MTKKTSGPAADDPARVESRRVLARVMRFVRDAAAAHEPLLGEVELAERVGATRKQVRDILAALEQQGIVHRRQGAATTVDPVAMRMGVRLEDQVEHEVLLQQLGYESAVEVISRLEVPLPAATAAMLMRTAGSRAAQVVKRWRADGAVAMLASDLLPLPDGAAVESLGDSIYETAQRLWGESITWEVTTPSAELLSPADAGLFERDPGIPVLTLDIVGIGTSGRRLFHAREIHDPGTVSYSLLRSPRPPQVFSTARYQF
jgi:Transcriptional regulators